jgi:hypothetical protein
MRYRQEGVVALTDRSRRPVRYANQLPEPIERLIVATKRDKPHWGARKACARATTRVSANSWCAGWPAMSGVRPGAPCTRVPDRHGLVKRARARRNRAEGTPLSLATAPNDLWCTDPWLEPEDRLQGGIQARQRPLLLPPDSDGPGFALTPGLRSP